MSRSITYSAPMTVTLGPVERLLVAYYAHRRRHTKGDVIRGMIRKFGKIDLNFNNDDFVKFAKDEYAPSEAKDDDEREALVFVAEMFVDKWKDEPTLP